MLIAVVFQRTSEVRASRDGWCEQSHNRFKGIDGKLRMKHRAGGRKDLGVRIGFALNEIAEKLGCDHGIGHPPFVKAC